MAQVTLPSPSLSLQTYLHVVRRRRRLIVLIAVLVTVLAALPSVLADSVYASTSKIQVASLTKDALFDEAETPIGQVITVSNEIEIVTSESIRAEVISRLPGVEFDGPDVTQLGFSETIEVRITANDPTVAADVANAYADVFVENRKTRSVAAHETQEKALRSQSAAASAELNGVTAQLENPELSASQIASLQITQSNLAQNIREWDGRADQLAVDAALLGDATRIINFGRVESSPLSPQPLQAGVIGAVLGILLGLAAAVVIDLAQDRITSEEDLEAVDPDTAILTTIPHADFERGAIVADQSVLEAFRYLKTGVRLYGLSSEARSVIVTSAIGSEGKTTTAALLAREMSDASDRVVLIDCDLRRPTVHEHFGIENDVGLTSLVLGDAQIGEAIHFVADNLAIVPAGPAVHNPTEMIGSKRFAEVVHAIIDQADFTILDSPPVLPVADTLIAGQLVDATILVTRIGEVRRRSLRQLLRRLEEAEIPVLGFVANDLPRQSFYGGYQGYYEPTREPAAAGSQS